MFTAPETKLTQELDAVRTKNDALVLLNKWKSNPAWLLEQTKIRVLLDYTPNSRVDTLYKFSGKRPSFVLNVDWGNNTVVGLYPVNKLGDGVREFRNIDGKSIAVKQFPRNKRFFASSNEEQVREYLRLQLTNEVELTRQANNDPDSIQHFFGIISRENKEQYVTARITMPMAPGQTARQVFKENLSQHQAIYLILKSTKALIELHNKGIIHGDIYDKNLMMNVIDSQHAIVTWIDFGCAYRLDGDDVIIVNADCPHWAPERVFPQKRVKPHTNQDVFSFGKMLQYLIENNSKLKILTKTYPSVERFIQQALEIVPENRPTLPAFYAELYTEYLHKADVITLVELLTIGDIFEQRQAAGQLASRVLSRTGIPRHHPTLYAIRDAAHGMTRLKELLSSTDSETKQHAEAILKADEELDQFYVETFRHNEVKRLVKLLRSDKTIITRGAVQYLTDRVLQEGLKNDATTLKALRNEDGITKLRALKRSTDQKDIQKNIDKIIDAHMMPIVAASFSPSRTSFFRTLANIHDVDITNPVISWLFPG